MKAILRLILGTLAIWLIGVVCPAAPPTTGRVIILDNDRILEGDIERQGDQFRVRRPNGETLLPVSKARALCQSMEEAYVFLRDRANLEDPDERLRLARWCRMYNLIDQAIHEANCAQELRPTHEETRRIIQMLKRAQPAAKNEPASAQANSESLPPVDFNHETIGLFVTKVQPILMNTCVSCHGGAQSGAFRLTHTYANTQAHPRATRQNLAAVLALVRREQPGDSPLLSWAVTVHGQSDKPPIKDRTAPAYKMLEEWVKLAVKGTPIRETPSIVETPRVEEPPSSIPFAVGVLPKPAAAAEPKAASPATPEPKQAPSAPTPTPESKPPATPVPADPFDPAIFNQQNPKK